MRKNSDELAIRRFLIMVCCSVLLHLTVATIIVASGGSEKPANVYRVEVKYLEAKTEPPEGPEPVAVAAAPEPLEREEPHTVPEKPEIVDVSDIVEPMSLETAGRLEEIMEILDIIETPIPLVENAIVTQDGGLGSGADMEDGGGNSLFAMEATGDGWGGEADGVGWGGGSGSFGLGGGTGGGFGGGTGNSRGPAKPEIYFAGMPGITPPVYERTPQPAYPTASRSMREQGEVLLKVEVLANGRVGQVEVEKTSGYSRLDAAALRTVRGWRFRPALKELEVIVCWVHIPIKFALS